MNTDSKQWLAITTNIVLFVSFFVYYKFYNELKQFSKMIIDAAPSIILVVGLVLVYSRDQMVLNRRKIKNEVEKSIIVTKYDIYFVIILMFGVFMAIITAPFIYDLSFGAMDVLQGIIGLLSIYFIKKRYFHYKFLWIQKDEYAIDMAINISFYDTMLLDGLSFITALVIVFIPGILFHSLLSTDIIQAFIAFFGIYWINKKYFQL